MAGTDNSSVVATVDKLGFKAGQIVIEFGYDDDVDGDFRQVVEAAVGSPLEDEAYDGVVDAVLLWWRDGEGDLTDELVDALTMLEEGGFIALVTPGRKRSDRVEAHDVAEACTTSGLTATGAVPLSPEWHAQRLVGRK
ncbi:MAG: DUF3052 domain-containing protein [Ornithinimicrobium sp.]